MERDTRTSPTDQKSITHGCLQTRGIHRCRWRRPYSPAPPWGRKTPPAELCPAPLPRSSLHILPSSYPPAWHVTDLPDSAFSPGWAVPDVLPKFTDLQDIFIPWSFLFKKTLCIVMSFLTAISFWRPGICYSFLASVNQQRMEAISPTCAGMERIFVSFCEGWWLWARSTWLCGLTPVRTTWHVDWHL